VETIRRIPETLLFPAPGLPKGHVLMGYGNMGQCPMLIDNECSIYEHRPQTCRNYDCRVFTGTGVRVDEHNQPEIAERVNRWRFSYRTMESRAEQTTLLKAAAFLQRNRDLFPDGSLPSQPGPLAAIAVRIHRLFAETSAQTNRPDAETVHAIMTALSQQRSSAKSSAPPRSSSSRRIGNKRRNQR
jgi:hypothetical protein